MCPSWGKASRELLTLTPLPQNRVGRKHYFSEKRENTISVTGLFSVEHAQTLQGLYTARLLAVPRGNGSWHPVLCAKVGHWMSNETTATKKREGNSLFNRMYISLKHFLFLGQTVNIIFETGLNIRLQYHCILKRTQLPLESAKWLPKTWRKLKILGGPNTELQITHVPIASLEFPLLENCQKQELEHQEETCFHRTPNRGLWVQTQWTVPMCIPNPGVFSNVNSWNLGSSFIKT